MKYVLPQTSKQSPLFEIIHIFWRVQPFSMHQNVQMWEWNFKFFISLVACSKSTPLSLLPHLSSSYSTVLPHPGFLAMRYHIIWTLLTHADNKWQTVLIVFCLWLEQYFYSSYNQCTVCWHAPPWMIGFHVDVSDSDSNCNQRTTVRA